MSFEFEVISAAIFNIIDIYLLYYLLNNKLTFRFSKGKLVPIYVVIYFLFLSVLLLPALFPAYPIKLPMMFVCYLALFIIYKGAVYLRIFWILASVFIMAISELVAAPVAALITHTDFAELTEVKSSYCIAMIISRFVWFIIVGWLTRSKYANRKMFQGFSKGIIAIVMIDGIYLTLIATLFYYNTIFLDIDTAITLSLWVLVIISALTIYLLQKIMRKSEEIMTTNMKLKQAEMEYKLTSDMTSVVESLRALRHDMNNHMSILQGLLSVKAYDDVEKYLTSITQELSVANSFYFPENKVLSVVLNNKISKALELGITFETDILTSVTPFSERDLCTVIGNILENAIEASSTHPNPYIFFSMHQDEQGFHIQCDNTYTISPVFENNRPITTKENKIMHGIGTQNICSVVETYQGTTRFYVDEQFHVTITIPGKKIKET